MCENRRVSRTVLPRVGVGPVGAWNGLLKVAAPFLSRQYRLTGERLHKLSG